MKLLLNRCLSTEHFKCLDSETILRFTRQQFMIDDLNDDMLVTMVKWCNQNCNDVYVIEPISGQLFIMFNDIHDMERFKLRFDGVDE